jgi:hypothetical protein
MVDHTVGRVLDLFGFESDAVRRWREADRHNPAGRRIRLVQGGED